MATHNKNTPHYSQPDAKRAAPRPGRPLGTPRFPSTTIDGELLAAFRAEAERSGLTLSAALDDAVRTWLAARAQRHALPGDTGTSASPTLQHHRPAKSNESSSGNPSR